MLSSGHDGSDANDKNGDERRASIALLRSWLYVCTIPVSMCARCKGIDLCCRALTGIWGSHQAGGYLHVKPASALPRALISTALI